MKAAITTIDSVVVEATFLKEDLQNLCLDKGYDFPEIENEAVKRSYVPHIRHRGEEKKHDKEWISYKKMGCRKNQFMA